MQHNMAMQVEKHMSRRTIEVQHNMAMQVQSLGAHQLGQQHEILLGARQPGALLEIGQATQNTSWSWGCAGSNWSTPATGWNSADYASMDLR